LAEILELIGERPVTIAREVTKIHEEFLRGTVSEVLGRLLEPVGEFTIVIDIGYETKNDQRAAATASDIAIEFGRMTNNSGISKRVAIGKLAKEYGLSTNAVYTAVEEAKKLVE